MESETQIVEWINQMGFSEGQTKVTLLKKIQEILIHQSPDLIPRYIDNILSYATDKNQDVKKSVIGFIEEVCKINIALLPSMATHLHVLLADPVVAVQKRLIQAANVIYKSTLMWICTTDTITPEIEMAWKMINDLKLQILNMVDSENEGIRTNSIKFLAGVVILQTHANENAPKASEDFSLDDVPMNLKLIRRRNLEEEATHIFDLLVKFHNSEHISGMNLMACMTALCDVGKTRPKFLSRVIKALEELHMTLPPTLTQSQVNSVRKHLRMQLVNVIKHSSSSEMIPQLAQMLLDLGMTSQEVSKVIPRDKRNKRLLEFKRGNVAKRARVDSPQSNSQGSEGSSQDAAIEEVQLPTLSIVTEKSLLEGLNDINCVIDLVCETMNSLPSEIPCEFNHLYEPISTSSTILPKSTIAKLLLAIIKEEPVSTSVPPEPKLDENKVNLKSALAKLQSKKQIDSAVSKLMEETMHETRVREAAREKEIMKNVENKAAVPETPTVPKLKQRVKTIKLLEVTKPLPKNVREKILLDAIGRILNAERCSRDGKVAHIREKILTTFAVSYSSIVREKILSFILEDIEFRIELALSWLYEEYTHVQEYNRSNLSVSKYSDKSGINYNNLLCSLITNIADMLDPSQEVLREILFRRIYLECPSVTDDALSFLTHMCVEEGKTLMGLNLLRDLVLFEPPKASKYVTSMLPLAIHENSTIREEAISRIVDVYQLPNESLKKAVDKHANLYLGFIALPDPPNTLYDTDKFQIGTAPVWTDELYKICLQLFIALLPYNDDSLTSLCRAYAGAGVEGKRCVLRLLDTPIHEMGAEHPVLLSFIEECPKGAETLVTKIIHLLTEKAAPTTHLVNKVRNLYVERVSDVRFLIPVITGLTKEEIFAALPKLIKLNPVVVKEVFSKLLGTQKDSQHNLPVTPAELLIALHYIDPSKAELKYVVKATSLCFAEKESYTSDVLEEVLIGLIDQPQLPVLLMRSVLQALTLHPTKLAPFVINILKSLVMKEVWEHKVVWEGFLKCCQRLKPQSCMVLITLPPEPLRWALESCKDLCMALDKVLPSLGSVPPHVTHITKECMSSAGLVSQDNHQEFLDGNVNEPLPPGMD